MNSEFDRDLAKYAEVIVKVGLNLQPGQRLLLGAPTFFYFLDGIPVHLAPLIRVITATAYKAGARLVDVMWTDEETRLARFLHASQDSLDEYPTWRVTAAEEYAERGDAVLMVYAHDVDMFAGIDPEIISSVSEAAARQFQPLMEHIGRGSMNWCMFSAPVPGWAAKVFPDLGADEQEKRLWETIFKICRVNTEDPVVAWRDHVDQLVARSDYLNVRRYVELVYQDPGAGQGTGQGTALTVGLPAGHRWLSGRLAARNGISFTANLPTEELFTMPHAERVDGVVSGTRPLSFGGELIEDLTLTFKNGQVIGSSARRGESALQSLLDTDAGARRLGEVALVPNSSPVSQTNLLFYNILIDENAASHMALGQAYRFCMAGGEEMSDEEFEAAGGNHSLIHADFMAGSGTLDVDGITSDGQAEPLMRGGEWAFEV
jgi:aminopeptidase